MPKTRSTTASQFLGIPSNQGKKVTTKEPVQDANRHGIDEKGAMQEIPTHICTFSVSAKAYHSELLNIITNNLPRKLAGTNSEMFRKGLTIHMISLFDQYKDLLPPEERKRAEQIIDYVNNYDKDFK